MVLNARYSRGHQDIEGSGSATKKHFHLMQWLLVEGTHDNYLGMESFSKILRSRALPRPPESPLKMGSGTPTFQRAAQMILIHT